MDAQAAVNATAKVLGGTLLREGVYSGAGALAANGVTIKFAYALLPEVIGDDGVIAIVYPNGYRKETGDAGDLTTYVHELRIQLLLSIARSTLPKAISILAPFAPVVEAAFAAKVLLAGAASGGSWLDRCEGFKDEQHGGLYPGRIALEFVLLAIQEEAVTYLA